MKTTKKHLKCVEEIHGFTVGRAYPIIDNGSSIVSVFDNNMIHRRFRKVEGASDFKNWFTMVDVEIHIIK